jgi:predicted nucleic acid-binding protein
LGLPSCLHGQRATKSNESQAEAGNSARVDAWVRQQDDTTLHLSAITIGERRKGLTILPEGKRRSQIQDWLENGLIVWFAGRILPMTQAMADGLIAAAALQQDLVVLVTRNVRDYQDLGVTILNPWEQP